MISKILNWAGVNVPRSDRTVPWLLCCLLDSCCRLNCKTGEDVSSARRCTSLYTRPVGQHKSVVTAHFCRGTRPPPAADSRSLLHFTFTRSSQSTKLEPWPETAARWGLGCSLEVPRLLFALHNFSFCSQQQQKKSIKIFKKEIKFRPNKTGRHTPLFLPSAGTSDHFSRRKSKPLNLFN